jgi:hypothetical protein
MITVATFSRPEQAHLLRMRLEAAGIRAFVQDENMVQMNWFYSNAIGGVRVQVAEEDLALAEEILRDEGIACEKPPPVFCPFCASLQVERDQIRKKFTYLLLLFYVVLPFPRHRFKCRECGKSWDEQKRPQASS